MKHLSNVFRAALVAVSLTSILAVPSVLVGCAALGIRTPANFDERMVAGHESVAAVADMTLAAFRAGKISKDEANDALDKAQSAENDLKLAQSLRNSGDFSSAETRLAATIAALELLQSQLRMK